MLTGVVKRWFDERGFGFITVDSSGKDVFVHRKTLVGIDTLEEGTAVTFTSEYDEQKGRWTCASCTTLNPEDAGPVPLPPGCKSGAKGGKGASKGASKGGGKGGKDQGGRGKDGYERGFGQGCAPKGQGRGPGPEFACGAPGPCGRPEAAAEAHSPEASMFLQAILSQAEVLCELPGNWVQCQFPRSGFFFNRATRKVCVDLPPELAQMQPQQPQQQQQFVPQPSLQRPQQFPEQQLQQQLAPPYQQQFLTAPHMMESTCNYPDLSFDDTDD
mmetsp:Transcript_67697/g.191826  ORF Transcript_67697/g.191826 Transcript_67697/m.191826 type:complete len:272 (+) Transcript_67697:81-896(+)